MISLKRKKTTGELVKATGVTDVGECTNPIRLRILKLVDLGLMTL